MNPKDPEARTRCGDPFQGMKIDDTRVLNILNSRSACQKCGKSRMYFCYTCYVPVSQLERNIPQCKLPIKVDIIKHQREIDGKSTAAHAAILAPFDVTIYNYPNIPDYELDGQTVLLYPGTEAVSVDELFENNKRKSTYAERLLAELPPGYNVGTLMTKIMTLQACKEEKPIYHAQELPIKRAVLIDSTWNQSRGIFAHETLQRLPKVVLQKRASEFWRHQRGSPRWYLSTIEALHQLLMELHTSAWGADPVYNTNLTSMFPIHNNTEKHLYCQPYNGQYDNLLFFFKHMYEKIHTLYKHDEILAYKRPMV